MAIRKSLLDLFGQSIEQRQADCLDQPRLNTYTDLLFFTLLSRSGAPVKIRPYL